MEESHVTIEFYHEQAPPSPVLTCINTHDPIDIPPTVNPKPIQIFSPKSSLALLPSAFITSTLPHLLTNPHHIKQSDPQRIYHRFEIISHLCIIMVGMAFFVWVYPLHEITWGLCITRLCAGSINMATFIILITINPDAIRFLIVHARGERWLPSHRMKQVHAKLGIFIAIDGLIHACVHMTENSSRIIEITSTSQGLQRLCDLLRTCPYTLSTTYSDMILSRSGMTGILLVIVMILIVTTSMPCVRKHNLSLFHYAHWCYIAYVILLPIHGSQGIGTFPMSWLFVTPVLWLWYSNIKHWLYPIHATLYIQPIPPISSKPEPAAACVALGRMLVPGVIDILPGMYIRIRVPMIDDESHQGNDWHQFTVTNASYILLHGQPLTLLHLLISAQDGKWTRRLINPTITHFDHKKKKRSHDTDSLDLIPPHDHLPPTWASSSTSTPRPVHPFPALFRGHLIASIPSQVVASPHLILVGMNVRATPVVTMLHYLLTHLEYQHAHEMEVVEEKKQQPSSSATPSPAQLQADDSHRPISHHDSIPAPIRRTTSSTTNTSHFTIDPFTFSSIVLLQRQQTQEHVDDRYGKSDTILNPIEPPPPFKRAASEKLLSRPSSVRLHLFRSKSTPINNTSDPMELPITLLIRQPLSILSHHPVRDVMAYQHGIHHHSHPPALTRAPSCVTGIAQTESSPPQVVRLPAYHLTSQIIEDHHTQLTRSHHVPHPIANLTTSTHVVEPPSHHHHLDRTPMTTNDSESGLGAIRTVEVFLVARTWVEIISVLFPFIPVEGAKYGPLPFIPSDVDADEDSHPLASRLPMRLHLWITQPEITIQQVREWNSNTNKSVEMDASLIALSRVISRLLKITASVTHTRPNFHTVFKDVQQHYATSYVHPVASIPHETCTTPISIPIHVYESGAEPEIHEMESICHHLSKKSIATANTVTVEFAFSAEYM